MFGKRKPKVRDEVERLRDPFLGDEELRSAMHQLETAMDWKPLDSLITNRADPIHARQAIRESTVNRGVVSTWATVEQSSLAHAQLGTVHVRDAWAARGSGQVSSVPDDAWAIFFDELRAAEETCVKGIELNPEDDAPWAVLLTTGRGLQTSKDELRYRFAQVHQRRPFARDACNQLLQGVCAKWSGSHEQMFDFARWIDAEAPADAAARGTIAQAHDEMYLSDRSWLGKADVQKELTRSLDAFLQAIAEDPDLSQVAALNDFVQVLKPTDAPSAVVATEAMRRIRDRPTSWDYHGGVKGYVKLKNEWDKTLPKLVKS